MEIARRAKQVPESIIVLDSNSRLAIHKLINSIREKLNELDLIEQKRESLFNKLNAFAAEVDRNRTRTESFLALSIEIRRAGGHIWSPVEKTVERIHDIVDKATKLKDALPPWSERKKLEAPPRQIEGPQALPRGADDEIPF